MQHDDEWKSFFSSAYCSSNEPWNHTLIEDLPRIDPRVIDARCRACDDAISSPQWRAFTLGQSTIVYACSACYERMRCAAMRERWRGTMHAYICHVFRKRGYWRIDDQPPPL